MTSFHRRSRDIQRLEKMFCDEGILLIKYWFHLSKGQQKKRLESLEADPNTRWRVTDVEWDYFKLYDSLSRSVSPSCARRRQAKRPGSWCPAPTLTSGR